MHVSIPCCDTLRASSLVFAPDAPFFPRSRTEGKFFVAFSAVRARATDARSLLRPLHFFGIDSRPKVPPLQLRANASVAAARSLARSCNRPPEARMYVAKLGNSFAANLEHFARSCNRRPIRRDVRCNFLQAEISGGRWVPTIFQPEEVERRELQSMFQAQSPRAHVSFGTRKDPLAQSQLHATNRCARH